MRKLKLMAAVLLSIAIVQSPTALADSEYNPVAREIRNAQATTLGVIVKLRKDGAGATIAKLATGTERTAALAKRTGLALALRREISDVMLASTVELEDASATQVLQRLRADAAVEYVSIDRRRYPHATNPNDPLFLNQWYLKRHRALGGECDHRLGSRRRLCGRGRRRARYRSPL